MVADACGTTSSLGDTLTYDRLRSIGAAVTVVNQMVTELVGDFGHRRRAEGAKDHGRRNHLEALQIGGSRAG